MSKKLNNPLTPLSGTVLGGVIEFFFGAAVFLLPFSKSAVEILMPVALGLWLITKAGGRGRWPSGAVRLRSPQGAAGACYAVFLLFTALSLIHVPAENLATGLRGLLKWVKYLAIFFMSADLFENPRTARRLIAVFLASVLLVAVNGFYQMGHGSDLVKHYSVDIPGRLVRMRSSLSSPNDLATFLMVALPPVFWWWLRRGRWDARGAFLAAALAILGMAFMMTLSRSAFFAFMLGLLFYLLFRKRALIPAVILVMAGILLARGIFRSNFLASVNLHDITIDERLRFWKITWRMIREHPWLGNGVNMFYLKFPAFAPAAETYRGYAHNCYLQMWSEIGLFGLLAFLTPVFLAVWRFMKNKETAGEFTLAGALFIGLAAFLIQGLFDTQFYALQTSVLFWVFWGGLHSMNPDLFYPARPKNTLPEKRPQ